MTASGMRRPPALTSVFEIAEMLRWGIISPHLDVYFIHALCRVPIDKQDQQGVAIGKHQQSASTFKRMTLAGLAASPKSCAACCMVCSEIMRFLSRPQGRCI